MYLQNSRPAVICATRQHKTRGIALTKPTPPTRARNVYRALLIGCLLVGFITHGRQVTQAQEHSNRKSTTVRHPQSAPNSPPGTAQVRVLIDGLSSQDSSSQTAQNNRPLSLPELSIQAAAITAYVEAADIAAYAAPLSVTTGEGIITLPAGPKRTLSIDVDNQWGLLIFQSPVYTLNLTAGTTTTLAVRLEPVETIIPLATATRSASHHSTTLTVLPDESLVHDLRLTVPAQASSQLTTIRVEEIYNPQQVPRPAQQASAIVSLQPHGLPLTHPATLAFPYYPLLISRLGLAEAHLQLSHFHADQQVWLPLPNQTLHIEESLITAQIGQFGLYTLTVGANPLQPAPTKNRVRQPTPQPNSHPILTQHKTEPTPQKAEWSNYRVSLTINTETSPPLGIVFRYQNSQTYYKLLWNAQLRSARLTKYSQGHQTLLAHQTLPQLPQPAYQLGLIASMDTFRMTLNHKTLLSATDSELRTGSVALSCESEEQNCFEDAKIED